MQQTNHDVCTQLEAEEFIRAFKDTFRYKLAVENGTVGQLEHDLIKVLLIYSNLWGGEFQGLAAAQAAVERIDKQRMEEAGRNQVYSSIGLCSFLEDKMTSEGEVEVHFRVSRILMDSWPKATGVHMYPVPPTDRDAILDIPEGGLGVYQYRVYTLLERAASIQYNEFPKWQGEQLKLREELFEHIRDKANRLYNYFTADIIL